MRSGLKSTARIALKVSAALVDPLFGQFSGPRILIYHRVGASFGREMEVSVDAFARQLDWLQDNGEIVALETAVERRGELGDDRIFVITFDDGYEDVYHNAFPLMKALGIPFTLYLTTRPIETGEAIDQRYPDARPLNWEQIREMISTGLVTVGAHTHTHVDLRAVGSDQIREELDRSNAAIELNTGHLPEHFTYPWGWWSEKADPLVRERYRTATVGSTSPITADSDTATLGRFPVLSSDRFFWFALRVKRGLRLENIVRRKLAGYSGP